MNKGIYKIKIIQSLSNINADFLQLILCMFVSHYILENPLYGGAMFLFTNIWILYFQGNLRHLRTKQKSKSNLIMWILLTLSIFAGLTIVFLYPVVMKKSEANYVSFFILLITARSVLTYRINNTYNDMQKSNFWIKIGFQFLFLIPIAFFAYWQFKGTIFYIVIAGSFITGVQLTFQGSMLAKFHKYTTEVTNRKSDIYKISSYKVFSGMTLFSQIAFSLGILLYICYVCFTQTKFVPGTYIMMAVWMSIVILVSELFSRFVNKKGWMLSLNLFIIGAACWIIGSIKMFDAADIFAVSLWTLFWGFGLACINAVMNRLNEDFKMVVRIAGQKISDKELYYGTLLLQIVAIIISNIIVLCILTFWNFVIPNFSETELPDTFRSIMIQLPVIFMLISIFLALKQPLDDRSREKLINYFQGTNQNKPTKKDLEKRLVHKYKVRFGVKIIATFIRPFLHLKVSGKEYMDASNYPSIFICNHGIFYGPVAAVIYLPTYFRPWVDRKMVDRDLSANEMYNRFIYNIPLLSEKAKRKFAYKLAGPVTWALNSFNPIAVERDNLRNIMSTFYTTVDVLTEGDNVLIFPERPHKVKLGDKETVMHETETVGSMFTGFASIGKMYYDKTGKELRFYPIYANKKGHTFKIGEPVIYNPNNPPKEEKERIANELKNKMMELKGDC